MKLIYMTLFPPYIYATVTDSPNVCIYSDDWTTTHKLQVCRHNAVFARAEARDFTAISHAENVYSQRECV